MTIDERKKMERNYIDLKLQVRDIEKVLDNNLPTDPIDLCQFINLLDRKTREVRHKLQEIGGKAFQNLDELKQKEWSGENE